MKETQEKIVKVTYVSCDRCGAEMSGNRYAEANARASFGGLELHIIDHRRDDVRSADLCEQCRNALCIWWGDAYGERWGEGD